MWWWHLGLVYRIGSVQCQECEEKVHLTALNGAQSVASIHCVYGGMARPSQPRCMQVVPLMVVWDGFTVHIFSFIHQT